MNYELYYYVPWPQCQMLREIDKEMEHWAYADNTNMIPGYFVEKEWFDKINGCEL